ncbi:MAG TPA: hypothetical protein VFW11_21030 [Cyclobacteriaceae bacterium]|nr:hypothetical protein [Cyclobacteriaceae bacterium]
MKSKLVLIIISMALFSCAGSYKAIKPATLSYTGEDDVDGLIASYRYDVLRETGNKKYANKELKKGIKLVAVKIENNTGRTISLRNDVRIYSGERQVLPLDPKIVHHSLRQPAPLYLLWGLLWLTITNCDDDDCSVTPIPVGLGIGLINVGIASSANSKFLDELYQTNILDKEIKAGETAYGLVGISAEVTSQLKFRLD